MHPTPLHDLAIILLASAAVTLLFHKIKVPEILGFLITGALLGNHALGLVNSGTEISVIAEVGVIFLLFAIGLEFSLRELLQIKRLVFFGGFLYLAVTISLGAGISRYFSLSLPQSIFYGFLLSMSSTVIVLRTLEAKHLTRGPTGNLSLAILLFQDIAVVPMALIIPLLNNGSAALTSNILLLIRNFLVLALSVYIIHRFLLTKILDWVAATRSQEIFTISIFAICIGCAYLTGLAGMSMPLGAFIAGLLLAGSNYGYQAAITVHSFRDLFAAFFFVSIGMMLDPTHVLNNGMAVFTVTTIILASKWLGGLVAVRLLRFPLRFAIVVAILLGQIGEFSFVLSQLGLTYNLISLDHYQTFLAAAILTMMLSPVFISYAPVLAYKITQRFVSGDDLSKLEPIEVTTAPTNKDHIVIVGFGLNGRNLAFAARRSKIPYVVIELDPEAVSHEKMSGEPVIYGDASFPHVLHKAGIMDARLACIVISDGFTTRKVVDTIQKLNPSLHTIVRTRAVEEVDPLLKLGAQEVVPEEFETSLEIFSRVLRRYLVAEATIEEMTEELRQQQYRKLTELEPGIPPVGQLVSPPPLSIETLQVSEEFNSPGKSIQDLDIRNRFGVTIVGIQRLATLIENPTSRATLEHNDFLFVLGKHRNILRLGKFLRGK